ncbi:MAG: carboxylating nicotinate-nucleotide diphosphorylase [Candidatus Micrarchaeia archaeon]
MKAGIRHFMGKPSARLAREAALAALLQDAASDATGEKCIPKAARCSGKIVAKSDFILCGAVEADAIFKSRSVSAKWKFREGAGVKKGQAVCTVSGNARAVLACERTALNYLSLLSGVATVCAQASRKYGKWKIAATRKTIPNLMHSEKRAVALGGCLTHRLTLADGILIKDNHIAAIMKAANIGEKRAVEFACGSFGLGEFVEVEVSSEETAIAAALSGAEAILVDNVSPEKLRKIAKAARKASPKIIIEASGGITIENAGAYLRAGADFASTSELTMKTAPANLSLEIEAF